LPLLPVLVNGIRALLVAVLAMQGLAWNMILEKAVDGK
jgi:hypothetical protein